MIISCSISELLLYGGSSLFDVSVDIHPYNNSRLINVIKLPGKTILPSLYPEPEADPFTRRGGPNTRHHASHAYMSHLRETDVGGRTMQRPSSRRGEARSRREASSGAGKHAPKPRAKVSHYHRAETPSWERQSKLNYEWNLGTETPCREVIDVKR